MHFKLAILTALSRRPDGRATLDDVRREVEALTGNEDQRTEQLSPLGIDIFQSGLVVTEGDGLQITDAGRSLLDALETFTESSLPPAPPPGSKSLKLIDDLVGTRERLKIFDLEPRKLDEQTDFSPLQQPASDGSSLGSELRTNMPKVSRRESLFKAIAARLERASSIWRGHLVRDVPNILAPRRSAGISGATFAILTVLVVTICAGALVAFTQIKALKAEIASLNRELLPLRERLTRYDQAEKAREAEIKAAAEKTKALIQNQSEQASLRFSREEVQLIREYIKPAPFAGPAAPAVNVGDPVTGGTIPFPSPLTDKVPKLIGARFAIRNGAIIISTKNSRKVDAVLAPN